MGPKKMKGGGRQFPSVHKPHAAIFQLASLTYQLTIEHASLTYQLTIEHASLTHQLTIEQVRFNLFPHSFSYYLEL